MVSLVVHHQPYCFVAYGRDASADRSEWEAWGQKPRPRLAHTFPLYAEADRLVEVAGHPLPPKALAREVEKLDSLAEGRVQQLDFVQTYALLGNEGPQSTTGSQHAAACARTKVCMGLPGPGHGSDLQTMIEYKLEKVRCGSQ